LLVVGEVVPGMVFVGMAVVEQAVSVQVQAYL
jgi:hypothetical protein